MSSLLVRGGKLVTMNQAREIITGSIYIENGVILEVGSQRTEADKVIEAGGMLVIPGMVQGHVHLCQALMRGMADDLDLLNWLEKRIWPLEAAHDFDSLYYSALLGCGEMLLSGTTTVLDMGTVKFQEAVFEAVKLAGIRAISGKCLMDHNSGHIPAALHDSTETSLQETVALLEKWHNQENGRIKYAPAPRFALSCSQKLLEAVSDLSRSYGVLIHTHAAENREEVQLVREMTGQGNIEYLGQTGLLGPRTVLAHCVWLSEAEEDLLLSSGTGVAHCPSANLKLASGIANVTRMLSRGIRVGIGCDGAPCNNYLDIFKEMYIAALLQKPFHGPQAMAAEQVLEMVTIGGASLLGLEKEIGSLEPGKRADLVVINPEKLHSQPWPENNVYAAILYQVKASDVRYTVVDGRVLVKEGRLTFADEILLKEKVNRQARLLRGRAGLQ